MLPDGIVQSDTGAVLVQAGGAITLADLLATAGEIAVSACDSIWRKPLAEKLALVGRHILLEAENGQIGTTADLIGARASGVLNASAWGDIWLWIDGDLTSDYLLSMAGGIDVATDGRMRVAKLSAQRTRRVLQLRRLGAPRPRRRFAQGVAAYGGIFAYDCFHGGQKRP